MTTIKHLFGTVLVVSLFWLCFTLMILTYHEELMRIGSNYDYDDMSEDTHEQVREYQQDEGRDDLTDDFIDNRDKRLHDLQQQDDMNDVPVRQDNQQRVNTPHNYEHEDNKYDKSDTSNENKDGGNVKNENFENVQNEKELPDIIKEADEQHIIAQGGDMQPNRNMQNSEFQEDKNDIHLEKEAAEEKNDPPAGNYVGQEFNNVDPAAKNKAMEASNDVHPENKAAEENNDSVNNDAAGAVNLAPQGVDAAKNDIVQQGNAAGNEAAQGDQQPPVIPEDMAAAIQKQMQDAMKQNMPGNAEENNESPVNNNVAAINEAPQGVDAAINEAPQGVNAAKNDIVRQGNAAGNEAVQGDQQPPVNPENMAAIQKQMQEAMKENMPGEAGDVQMMIPNVEDIQAALAGRQQPNGMQIIPIQGNPDNENPMDGVQQQIEGGGNILGNMNGLNGAENAGNPFGNLQALGFGNPLLGNNGIGAVNPLAALMGAANNPAMQFNMEPDNEDPPYKWEVDLDSVVKRAPKNAPGK